MQAQQCKAFTPPIQGTASLAEPACKGVARLGGGLALQTKLGREEKDILLSLPS